MNDSRRTRRHQPQAILTRALLDSEETGAFLGYSSRTIRRLVKDGILPVVHIPGSRALRFRPEALTEVAKRFEVPAADVILDGGAE